MNIVLIIFDSLRQDHVGAYGNEWIHTPHLDAFAKESAVFTGCYPDSLPTVQFRKAIRTGNRVYPFRGHKNYRGNVARALPGWSPLNEVDDTLPEILGEHGYTSCFITDCYHQFKPTNNYWRGFDEWHLIRGQEGDKYKTGEIGQTDVDKHLNDKIKGDDRIRARLYDFIRNTYEYKAEEDRFPAQVFRQGALWLEENANAGNTFMIIDSFDPHEPWTPPLQYRKLYDPNDDVVDLVQSPYHPWKAVMSERELKRLQANYAGEVTLCDRWFGYFMESLKYSGRLEDTVVCVMSDHGHNLGYDPADKGYVGKQGHPSTRAVMDLVCMIRHPKKEGADTVHDGLIYNIDITATLLAMAGISPKQPMDGNNVWPTVLDGSSGGRDHVSIGYGVAITVIDNAFWYNTNMWKEEELLYSLKDDPGMTDNLAGDNPEVCERMFAMAKQDAGGEFPKELESYQDRVGANVNAWLERPFGNIL